MKVLREGKPWSSHVVCSQCGSTLEINNSSLEFHDVKHSPSGIGYTCPVCASKESFEGEVPPMTIEQVRKRKGFAQTAPVVIQRARPEGFLLQCGACEAELLVESHDLTVVGQAAQTRCVFCNAELALPLESLPSDMRDFLCDATKTFFK
jgi:hypothetical protein